MTNKLQLSTKPGSGSGRTQQLWALVLNFNISFSISSGCGRTEYLMPHLHKALPVVCYYYQFKMKTFFIILFTLACCLTTASAYSQTYNSLISDSEYFDFINKDILRDSIKVKHHIFRKHYPLLENEFFYKDSADFLLKNVTTNIHFIFRRFPYGHKTITNDLDTIFNRKDIDFFGEQFRAMTKDTIWRIPFTNSIFIDSIEYEKDDKQVGRKRSKWGVWAYSLPLFSLDRHYAIIIKASSTGGGYYIYKLDEYGGWFLIKILNPWSEG
ncbi:MAG: hypothetical protein IPN43_17270 [Chitinophagaceae bacterium]|nr:hypothetical protein [Chitinophagaceae bacterium]